MNGEPLAYCPRSGTERTLHECGVNKWNPSRHSLNTETETVFGVPTAWKTHHAVTFWAQSVMVIKHIRVQSTRVAADTGNFLELSLSFEATAFSGQESKYYPVGSNHTCTNPQQPNVHSRDEHKTD